MIGLPNKIKTTIVVTSTLRVNPCTAKTVYSFKQVSTKKYVSEINDIFVVIYEIIDFGRWLFYKNRDIFLDLKLEIAQPLKR